MRVRWMLALLAAALLFGGLLAGLSFGGVPVSFGLSMAAGAWFVAVAIALVLLAPVALVRRRRPPGAAIGAALVVGGLLVFPVGDGFYSERHWAEQGGGVGRCLGVVALPESLHNHITGDEYARFAVWQACDD